MCGSLPIHSSSPPFPPSPPFPASEHLRLLPAPRQILRLPDLAKLIDLIPKLDLGRRVEVPVLAVQFHDRYIPVPRVLHGVHVVVVEVEPFGRPEYVRGLRPLEDAVCEPVGKLPPGNVEQ